MTIKYFENKKTGSLTERLTVGCLESIGSHSARSVVDVTEVTVDVGSLVTRTHDKHTIRHVHLLLFRGVVVVATSSKEGCAHHQYCKTQKILFHLV